MSRSRCCCLVHYAPVRTYAEQLADDVTRLLQATAGRN